jgi:hypothetical protein
MYSELDGAIATVRIRFNVVWCGFCDRSRMIDDAWDLETGVSCDGCDAMFKDEDFLAEVEEEIAETPRRRRRRSIDEEVISQEEADQEDIQEETEE